MPRHITIISRGLDHRIRLHTGWRFQRSESNPDGLIYDLRPDANGTELQVLRPWILPDANQYIRDTDKHHARPPGNPGANVSFVWNDFDDSSWQSITVPHDWAIAGPFQNDSFLSSMGSLPVYGVGWYRNTVTIPAEYKDGNLLLEVDGAMSYPMVWLNGNFVGGWAYGYNSFQLDLTPFVRFGQENLLAIRTEGPWDTFSRWYPGAGLYRNVWIASVSPVHVVQYGTHVISRDVTEESATVDLSVQIENSGKDEIQRVEVVTTTFEVESRSGLSGNKIANRQSTFLDIPPNERVATNISFKIDRPRLWGPVPSQTPSLYKAVTQLYRESMLIDTYNTTFGIRSVEMSSTNGLLINGKRVYIQGVNMHHDLGPIGAAFNTRAAERQLQILQDMGVNAIRTAHNPPAPELLDLTDRMGMLVLDEIFDCWEVAKTPSDYHLIFPDWHEPDLRSFIRRDRNHPSVFMWSFGNEVPEQSVALDARAAVIATALGDIVKQEDPTRLSTCSMNLSKPNQSLPNALDVIALNYQGEGIRYGPGYEHLTGNRSPPQYDAFHAKFPEKAIFGSEIAWSLSTRGTFFFPVTNLTSAPANDTSLVADGGGNSTLKEVSAYELYTSQAGSSPEKVFAAQDTHPFVAGGFVWVGFDHLGEPYPYEGTRSTISGVLDLSGFKKERFWLYQARWRSETRMAKIVPHWTWAGREGLITPVHVFTSADEGEIFVNNVSQGRLTKDADAYRFRWDQVIYEPGELRVVTWKNGTFWAEDRVRTAGQASKLVLTADRSVVAADGEDLSFVTAEVLDADGNFVPDANAHITFSVNGTGEIIATDNGFAGDYVSFQSTMRAAFNGMALVVVRSIPDMSGLEAAVVEIGTRSFISTHAM
ncbi:beta-galactosidase [Pseudovirgaria hyperparasitica]|uniref:Beta-galactosidase n=1 Tax=Pseudovirgaria hyperparasitica TaxID=470096 RepID=A0A6A6WIY1_9PEZI|nr:beta-galactosidase [Pseudovirgaria hyperparasitica]KAF2762066.1 beta-galactosidase [Pseudovirgaria hyperparasitica]